MPASATTIVRPGLLCAITATLALAGVAPRAGAQAAGGFTAPDDPAVPALISSLRGCVDSLAPGDRRLLALRAGLGGHAPELTAQVAAALGVTPAAASAAEIAAIRKLEALRRRGACQVRPASAPAPTPAPAPAATPTPAPTPAATPTPAPTPAATPAPTPAAKPQPATKKAASKPATTTASGDSTTSLLEVVVPALLVLAFAAGISLEMNRRPPGR